MGLSFLRDRKIGRRIKDELEGLNASLIHNNVLRDINGK